MAEFDAFGNKIEAETKIDPVPSDEPVVTPTPTPEGSGLKLSGRPSRFGGGGGGIGAGPIIALVIVLITVAGGAIVAFQVSDQVDETIRRFTPTGSLPALTVDEDPGSTDQPGTSTEKGSVKPEKPVVPPVGLGPRSLIRQAHFAAAIKALRNAHKGNLVYVRVAPDRINAQLQKNGYLRNLQVGTDGKVQQFGDASGPGFSSPTINFSDVNSHAPERLVRGGVRQGGVKAKNIDYLVITKFGDQVIWNAYFKNGRRYQGSASGRVTGKF